MKINNVSLPGTGGCAPVQEATRVEGAAAVSPNAKTNTSSSRPLQSAMLEPAMAALQGLPEIDQAKVEALRDALDKGEISFDAKKLAGLIARYHGGR